MLGGRAGLLLACSLLVFGMAAFAQEPEPARPVVEAGVSSDEDVALIAARRQISAGRFHDAISTLQEAVQDDDGKDVRRLARRLGTLGIALNQAGAYGEAIEAHHRALALYEALDDPAGTSAVTSNIGGALSSLGDSDGARHYLEEALAIKRRHGIGRGVGTIYASMAELADAQGDLETARQALEQALEAYAGTPDPSAESVARTNLGRVLAKLGQHAEALEQVRIAETLARTHDHQVGVLAAQAAHAQVLMTRLRAEYLPEAEQEALLTQAEASLHQALAVSRAQEDRDRSIRLMEAFSELRQIQGHPEQALEFLQQARALEEAQRRDADLARARVLSARYGHQHQRREIERLRDVEARHEDRLKRQRYGLWLLAALVLLAAGSVLGLWYRSHRRYGATVQLKEHNERLSAALKQAHQERQRTETFAMRQRRFLRLASDDLRGPLLETRALAERALVEDKPDILRRSHAAIAQHAADLIWVTEQMLESAAHEVGVDAPRPAESVDLVPVLRDLVGEAVPRALQRDQHLAFQCQTANAPVWVERIRCLVALRELIDILLYLNPARSRHTLTLECSDKEVRIGLDAGTARLPDWQDIALGKPSSDVTLRLALAWIQHTIEDSGGTIETERHAEPGRREIVIRFPREGSFA